MRPNFRRSTSSTDDADQWQSDELTIDADWLSVVGAPEAVLNASGQVMLPTKQFFAEWKELLARVIAALEASGLSAF